MTDKENPCAGMKKNKETGRKNIYISDEMMNNLLSYADNDLKNAIKLAYLTGQRPADVLKMKWQDIYSQNGKSYLFILQNKTKTKVSIEITGELKELLESMHKGKNSILGITTSMLRGKFDKARELASIDKNKFQFRDLRAKAGTDTANNKGLETAQRQLGHKNLSMTQHYYRDEKGLRVEPTR
jgi:integrase